MSAIALQFVLGAGLSSRLIAWYGQGYGGWSHVDAVLSDGSLLGARDDVIRTAGGLELKAGVQIRPPHYETWKQRAVVEIEATGEEARIWEAWLRLQIGRPYDSGAIWGFILGNREHDKGHWICSACQGGALMTCGKMGRPPYPLSQMTPDTLYSIALCGLRGTLHSF